MKQTVKEAAKENILFNHRTYTDEIYAQSGLLLSEHRHHPPTILPHALSSPI
jgi:hypothetical protein